MPSDTTQNSGSSSLARIAGGSAMFLVVGKALTLGAVLALSALIPLGAFGNFMYGRGIVLFLGPFMALGLTVTAMRRIPAYLGTEDSARALGYLRTLSWTTLVVSVLVALLVLCAAPFVLPEERARVLQLAILALPGFAGLVAHMQGARAAGHVRLAYAAQSLGQPLAFVLGVVLLVLVLDVTEARWIALIFALSMLGAAAWQARGIWRIAAFRDVTPVFERRLWQGEALPLTLSLAAQGITASGPLLILGLYADSAALGIFGFYQALMQGLLIFNTAIFGATNPRLSLQMARGEKGAAGALLRRSRLAAMAISLAGATVAVLLVVNFGGLIQPAFTTEPLTLSLLLGSVAVNALAGPLGHVLIIEDRRAWEIAVQIACALLTLVLAVVLIPLMGLLGAALATFGAALLRVVATHVLVYGRLGYRL